MFARKRYGARWLLAPLGVVLLAAGGADGQVVREDGVASVARVLDYSSLPGGSALVDDFTFLAQGDQVLFASIDAGVYQSDGPGQGHVEAAAEEPGGGCADEGGTGFCLQLLDASGNVLCWAARPRAPGWQRDPRLACALPAAAGQPGRYTLRVSLADESCGDGVYPDAPEGRASLAYLLNVSVRRVAPEGALPPAIGQSRNRF